MKATSLLLIFIFLIGKLFCQVNKKNENESNIELLKQLTFCKCLTASLNTFSQIDSTEMSETEILNSMESHGLFDNRIGPMLDSIVSLIVKKQIANKQKNDPFKSVESIGKTTYTISCLAYYQSKQLDSFLRAIPKREYIVKQ